MIARSLVLLATIACLSLYPAEAAQLPAQSRTRSPGRSRSTNTRGRRNKRSSRRRGGEEAYQTKQEENKEENKEEGQDEKEIDDEIKWSWDEEAEKNAPIKLAVGITLFVVKAFNPAWLDSLQTTARKLPNIPTMVTRQLHLPLPATTTSTSEIAIAFDTGGSATIPELTFNLVKAIVGIGILSLPAGITAFGSAPSAVLPALVLVALMGVVSAVGFSWIAQVCASTGAKSYQQAWSRSVSPETTWIPTVSALGKALLACLSYSMVLADSLRAFVPFVRDRTEMLWTVATLVLLPLCWNKDLQSLVPYSMTGVFGMVFAVLAMLYRYARGSYDLGSPLLRDLTTDLKPAFGGEGWKTVFRPSSVLFLSMLSTNYMCHFNSPKFYAELKDASVPRFNQVVKAGFGIAILLSALVAALGFLTFGSNCDGFILNNYSPNDDWIHLSRLAVSVSIICSYPISFQALRDGVLDVMEVPATQRSSRVLNQSTVIILFLMTALATVLTDVSFVVAFGGAALGNLLVYVFPAVMYGRVEPGARIPAILLGGVGVALGLFGSYLSLKSLGSLV